MHLQLLCSYAFPLSVGVSPLVEQYYNWTVTSANLLFLGAGICALFSFVSVRLLSNRCSDRDMMIWSLSMGALGSILLISFPSYPLPAWRFLLGFFTVSVAFPVGRGTTVALYTKILPREIQGTGQGVILAVGAIARIFGPFFAVYALNVPVGSLFVFGCAAFMFAACLCLAVIYYSVLTVPCKHFLSDRVSTSHVNG